MSTTPEAILAAARAKLITVATSRDAGEFFLEHEGSTAFETTPKSKRDGFEVVQREYRQTAGFGVLGEAERGFAMVVRLGHASFGLDKVREDRRVADVERIADIFEALAWPVGTQVVLYEKDEVDKKKPSWWLTEIWFRVVYMGAIRS